MRIRLLYVLECVAQFCHHPVDEMILGVGGDESSDASDTLCGRHQDARIGCQHNAGTALEYLDQIGKSKKPSEIDRMYLRHVRIIPPRLRCCRAEQIVEFVVNLV
jgi:hypothetical protein